MSARPWWKPKIHGPSWDLIGGVIWFLSLLGLLLAGGFIAELACGHRR